MRGRYSFAKIVKNIEMNKYMGKKRELDFAL